jgi:hypothetical protein
MSVLILTAMAGAGLHGILIGFLVIVICIAVIAGLIWCIEQWISPIPPMVKLVVAIIILILIIIWAMGAMGISI